MRTKIKDRIRYISAALVLSFGVISAPLSTVFFGSTAAAAPITGATDISTGPTSACAVVDYKAICWGEGVNGQLGDNLAKDSSKPVNVYAKAAWTETIKCSSIERLFGCKDKVVNHAASPLYKKNVIKVSVGRVHACALTDEALVYCWGKNDKGQLGNGKSGTSARENAPVAVARTDGSALSTKEAIDISAGDDFTCALTTDGVVTCWGEGDLGRLGNGATTDKALPTAVSTTNGSALANKQGIRLAKAGGSTMCVLAVDRNSESDGTSGAPVCWGYGINDGRAFPASSSLTVKCDKNSAEAKPSNTTTATVIFDSKIPVSVPGANLAEADGDSYVTGLGADGKAYYWGMYGYKKIFTYTNITTCKVNPCTGKVSITQSDRGNVVLAKAPTQNNKPSTNNKPTQNNKPTNNNKPSNSNKPSNNNSSSGSNNNKTTKANQTQSATNTTNALNAAQNAAKGIPGAVVSGNGNTATVTYPNGTTKTFKSSNNGNSNSGGGVGTINIYTLCNPVTHYGYTVKTSYEAVGKKAATVPPAWPQTQGGISVLSGNVNDGLFCAVQQNKPQCDTHGTSAVEGQTGSAYVRQCTTTTADAKAGTADARTSSGATRTVCDSAPTGPQQVVTNGWLSGKTIEKLDTSASGYTCALASGSLGCWGINTKGQLGVGNTTNRNVPTVLGL